MPKALNYSIYSFLDTSMSPAERVYKIWYSIFFFRAWRSWLMNSKGHTLKECFISANCYTCIELNGHTLIKQILKARNDDTYSFMPYQQGSQPCEATFRQVRSMSSTFSTVVNCSMIDIIYRIRKIQLQFDIVHICKGTYKFPRLESKEKQKASASTLQLLPSEQDIIALIEKAKSDVVKDMSNLDIDISKLDFKCQVQPTKFQHEFHYEDIDAADSDDENEGDESHNDNTDFGDEFGDDLHVISGLTGELQMRDYSTSGIQLQENGIFAIVVDSTGKESVVRKSSICWLLSSDKYKLSSDRLQRVMERDYQNSGKRI